MAALEPAVPAEAPVKNDAEHEHDTKDRWIAEFESELWHILEVHAVDAGERRRHGEDRGPSGELLGDSRLLALAHQHAGLECEGKNLAHVVDLLLDGADMVRHVVEEGVHRRT